MFFDKTKLLATAESGLPIQVLVMGISMQPLLHTGDLVTIVKKNNYYVGDILFYYYPNEGYLLHRLIAVEADGIFVCKGDNAKRRERISVRQIVGVLMKAIRGEVCIYERSKQQE